jgi:chaperonin cofactor prefoldin
MLRKQENTNQLQVLQTKLYELEDEIKKIKSSLKNDSSKVMGMEQVLGSNSNKTIGNNLVGMGIKGFSEKKLAEKMLQIVTSSIKSSVPSSFMR